MVTRSQAIENIGLTGSLSIEANAGEYVVAIVSVRDDIIYDSAWTLVHESEYIYSDQTYKQKLAFLYIKASATGTITFSFTQETSLRYMINLVVIEDCIGIVYHEGSERILLGTTFSVQRPNYPNLIWGCSAVYAVNNVSWSSDTLTDSVQSTCRLGTFMDGVGMPPARSFTQPTTSSTANYTIIDCIEVLVALDYKVSETSSATSLTSVINSRINNFVLATVCVRSELSYPSDWILLGIGQPIESNQMMAFLCRRTPVNEEVSLTVGQETAGRIYLNLINLANVSSISYLGNTEVQQTGSKVETSKPSGYSFVVWGVHRTYWASSSPFGIWECSQISRPVISLDQTQTQPRLGNFIDKDGSSERVFVDTSASSSDTRICAADCVVIETCSYDTHGEVEYAITDIQTMGHIYSGVISWEDAIDSYTSIRVYIKLDGGTYQEVHSGDILPITFPDDLTNSTLYIKIVLDTQNSSVTPSLSNLMLSLITSYSRKNIILFFGSGTTGSFRNAVGDITVEYDGASDLRGLGGQVDSFTRQFTPEDLLMKPNQNDQEHVSLASVLGSADNFAITYRYGYNSEHVTLSNTSGTIQLIHVDDL